MHQICFFSSWTRLVTRYFLNLVIIRFANQSKSYQIFLWSFLRLRKSARMWQLWMQRRNCLNKSKERSIKPGISSKSLTTWFEIASFSAMGPVCSPWKYPGSPGLDCRVEFKHFPSKSEMQSKTLLWTWPSLQRECPGGYHHRWI